MPKILITGSEGLVGSALRAQLEAPDPSGPTARVRGLDLRAPSGRPDRGDIRSPDDLERAVEDCDGIVHLAAVSRVVWAERQPELCWRTNAVGTRNVLRAAAASAKTPWVVTASSREVYGQPDTLPAAETAPLNPVNIYGEAKVAGERATLAGREEGLNTAIIRLSNVYGRTDDYADRVVPAFARGAVLGETLRVDGSGHTFDFTHLDDTVRGILRLIEALEAGEESLPPIHFLTGRPTTLGELAALAVEHAGTDADVREAPPRSFDVSHFYGDPGRARKLLGWSPRIDIDEGVDRLVADFRAELAAATPSQTYA